MITRIDFCHINSRDEIECTVDKFSENIVKQFSKTMNDGEMWCNVYDDGRVQYGYTVEHDPYHSNQKYTWSSNAHDINKELGLNGTEWQVTEACFREFESCVFSSGILTSLAKTLAIHNQDRLKYGLMKYLKQIHEVKLLALDPHYGMTIIDDSIRENVDGSWNTYQKVQTKDGTIGYMLWSSAKYGEPCLSDWVYRKYGVLGGKMFDNKTLLPKEEMKLW